jgi:DNA-binding IclR family transcriptional regulator
MRVQKPAMSAAAEAYFVSRTMQAMEALTFQSASAPEIAGALQVHPRTARRLLNRLVADGWLTRSEGRRRTYTPTLRIVALAAQLAARSPLIQLAASTVEALRDETGDVAYLAIPSYRSALCVVMSRPGDGEPHGTCELIPAHASAAGKVLLAHRHPWRESVLALPLDAVTAETITDADVLRAQAVDIRARGHAVDHGEHKRSLNSIAAPVWTRDGEVVAALALSTSRPVGDPDIVGSVMRHAERLSGALGQAGNERARPRDSAQGSP